MVLGKMHLAKSHLPLVNTFTIYGSYAFRADFGDKMGNPDFVHYHPEGSHVKYIIPSILEEIQTLSPRGCH